MLILIVQISLHLQTRAFWFLPKLQDALVRGDSPFIDCFGKGSMIGGEANLDFQDQYFNSQYTLATNEVSKFKLTINKEFFFITAKYWKLDSYCYAWSDLLLFLWDI